MNRQELEGALGLDVSRETYDRLSSFAALVAKWNPVVNLVAKSTIADIWLRHIVDSAQILNHAPDNITHWVDLGSGGGFPGLVIAIMLTDRQPNARLTLVESDQRKAAFLAEAKRQFASSCDVISSRAEAIEPLGADVLTARALAPLNRLLPLVSRHLLPGGVGFFPKGEGYQQEMSLASAEWRFTSRTHQSITNPKAVIVEIRNLVHV